ncbi:glycosyltransferase family 4 protein [bacterium]|nr:glycosyltransferase family 4 protein [bacterium]MCI0603231.1 glycosyltransferase family 4 protein [bacterium]
MSSRLHMITGVNAQGTDIFHLLHQDSRYEPIRFNGKYVLTIHDLNFRLRYKGSMLNKRFKRLQSRINRAQLVTTISHYVLGQVRQYFKMSCPANVIYNGNTIDLSIRAVKPSWIPDRPFLFSLGIISKTKNISALLPFLQKTKDYNLIIAGNKKGEYAKSIHQKIGSDQLTSRVFMPGEISESEKLWLYKNCDAFLFPSTAEGFGLPLVEAMSVGKPVFAYYGSSLPEIGGDVAFYWHDFDPQNMCDVFVKGMHDFSVHPGKANQLKERAALFNWNQSAREYVSLYNSV